MSETIILSELAIKSKLKRMAIEIFENNFQEKEIVLLGIVDRGLFIAEYLAEEIRKENSLKVHVGSITINKDEPLKSPVQLHSPVDLENKAIIIVDDVANSGKTLFYALQPLMPYSFKKIQIAVLVERQHKKYPITPDYIGISVSTTLQEMIYVNIGKEVSEPVAYLS
jgi:pyrimidine operon attenuation protein/uracil phosphoribosyltransferase